MWTVLLVEDEVFVRESVRRIVDWHSLGFDVIGEAGNGEDALALIRQQRPDLVICDILMPKMNGVEVLKRVREDEIDSRFIMLSCLSDFEYVRQAMEYGASNYILKLSMNVQSLMDSLVKVDSELRKRHKHEARQSASADGPGGKPSGYEEERLGTEAGVVASDESGAAATGPDGPAAGLQAPLPARTGHKEVDKLIRYMAENYRSIISLKTLAAQVAMDEKYISTLFKKKTGINVIHYLHQLRITEAKRRLEQSALPVSEIGLQVGYENDNYFIKIFKRFTGMTPNTYRSQFNGRRQWPPASQP
ncbi:Helix-turn-helix domain-containing protein [Paenibacillus sp. UNCCL117]|uniref:response regulator n=1 Tax=unclassified Paenibacillus TaxID=185978 RepID=UPI00087FE64D|nr:MULTISPECIES: response regulator [unclassified Paenibacillus]SDE44785.1 Helix-turn-helix domain-containing protein [Paenibacillus sp. cl123]SFW46357.1 Helix-turn-helix domain-containing protein [Paenibacillus sp. UNCCL117]